MPNSAHPPQEACSKTYNISVVGPPKAGKSCLCNRFALPHPDYYRKDHLSVLSAADFVGEIVNLDHWLYWGCVSRQVDDYTVNFRIIEQTEFIDDSTFQPFVSQKQGIEPGCKEDYVQRSTTIHLSSEHKLRYICKDQLGQENTYEREYFPSGDIEVNGFVLVCDVSRQLLGSHPRADRNSVPQQTIIQEILTLLLKLKKPVVLAVSKFDTYRSQAVEELSSLLQKSSDFKRIPLIETSAHENINVENTFLSLVKLMDKPRAPKIRCLRYVDAVQERKAELSNALTSFCKVMCQAPCEFLNGWDAFMARYSQQADVVTYLRLVGTSEACSKFEDYVKHRRHVTKQHNLDQIAGLLSHFVPNLDIVRNK
ncbi:Glucocorticoid receptor DNA-binding factor 1 [Fasciola hepatica]|uniref:Glucocorticoid receptor DNA-binding factor 1 n=1 Tax=Fasciola hepatica TaxID=6192 RepID=A0A2H1CNL3_FASHE|nr:Glucocorticoid receptor DNA-binding factor 1 [Fasciola hepatica]